MQIWRIHIRPRGGLSDPAYSFGICEKQGVIGVGWQVDRAPHETLDLEEYLRRAKQDYVDTWSSCKSAVTLLNKMEFGDLVWTRDTKGIYWLGRVNGPWEYRDAQENRDADIANVRPVHLVQVGTVADVPGKVVASMRGRRTLQRISGDTTRIYSEHVMAEFEGASPPRNQGLDIFELLSDQDCEDVIFVLLQCRGWVVFPARRQADTMSYEYILRNRNYGQIAVAQVKTGSASIHFDALPEARRAFVFQPNGCFEGHPRNDVEILDRAEVIKFMRENRGVLPPAVCGWMDIADLH
jgi:hypothetical protein